MEDLIIQDEFDVPVVEEKTIDIIGTEEEKEIKKDETEVINKIDDVVLLDSDINSLRSNQIITMNKVYEDFDVTELYYDGTLVGLSSTEFQLSDSILNYDYILFRWKGSNTLASGVDFFEIVDSNMFYNSIGDSKSKLTIGYRGTNAYGTRIINPREDPTKIGVSNSILFNSTVNNNYNILYAVYGLNIKTLSNNDVPTPNPSVSGNVINNYYITVSGNGSVSYNLLNKPLNEYTPTESMFALSLLFALCMAFVILIRKVVFRWK